MVRMFESDCPLAVCDGSGLLSVTDWTGGGPTTCACAYGLTRADAAERRALVVEGEAKARRRAQELIHDSFNREGERR